MEPFDVELVLENTATTSEHAHGRTTYSISLVVAEDRLTSGYPLALGGLKGKVTEAAYGRLCYPGRTGWGAVGRDISSPHMPKPM